MPGSISGIVHLVEGDGDAAVDHLERAARLDPLSHLGEIARAHIGLGRAAQGDYPAAVRLLRATTFRSARIHLVLAALYGQLGMFDASQGELSLYAASSQVPVETMINFSSRSPALRASVLEGIAKTRDRPTP